MMHRRKSNLTPKAIGQFLLITRLRNLEKMPLKYKRRLKMIEDSGVLIPYREKRLKPGIELFGILEHLEADKSY